MLHSKIHKIRQAVPKKDDLTENVSGNYLSLKLESWLEAEPSVLMWEIYFEQMIAKEVGFGKNKHDVDGGWRIELQFVRANSFNSEVKLADGVFIISGFIKNTLEVVKGKPQEAYFLSLTSQNFSGQKTYLSTQELWQELTTLGIKK